MRVALDDGYHEAAILILHGGAGVGLGEAPALSARGGDLAAVCAELRAGAPRSAAARAAWTSAQLDLRARQAGVAVAELLGGAHRRAVRCNHLVRSGSPAAVAAEVKAAAAGGFRTFKLKALDSGGPLDQERLGAARHAAGPDGRLRLDLNGAELQGGLRSLRRFGLEFVEQPLPTAAPLARWLQLGPGAAADESLGQPGLARELAASGVAIAIKLATVGGPGAALALASVAAGPVLLASSFETSIGIAAALHTACALRGEPLDCGLATAGLLDADLGRGLVMAGSWLGLPPGPGLGVELDRVELDRYRVAA